MKEDWKVYIKGVQERGDEVIKALEERGASNLRNFSCGDDDYLLFYISHNGIIDFAGLGTEKAKIIMDNYHELHLPEQWKGGDWKDGDILIRKDNNNLFCVYQKPVDNGKGFLCHVYVSKDTLFTGATVPTDPADNYRKATDAEKSTFYSLIDNHHMRWDAENKKLVDWEWKPAVGDEYWVVTTDGVEGHLTWNNDSADIRLFNFGNCFRTSEDARIAIEKIKHLLKEE